MRTRRFVALNGLKGKYSKLVDKIAIYDENRKYHNIIGNAERTE